MLYVLVLIALFLPSSNGEMQDIELRGLETACETRNPISKICYDLDVPMEDIPEEFVPLKNFFHSLVDMAVAKRHRVIILLGEAFYSPCLLK